MGTLLSVDWDFFFPVLSTEDDKDFLYDWGHSEVNRKIDNLLWTTRAGGFLRADKPLPGTSGEETSFWKKFRIGSHTKLFLADSHKDILRQPVSHHHYDLILNFDAHHDSGYGKPTSDIRFTCEDWTRYFTNKGVPVKVIYPKWKEKFAFTEDKLDELTKLVEVSIDSGEHPPYNISHIFICRSGTWVPPWLDDKFKRLVSDCPAGKRGLVGPLDKRIFNLAEATKYSDQLVDLMNQLSEKKV